MNPLDELGERLDDTASRHRKVADLMAGVGFHELAGTMIDLALHMESTAEQVRVGDFHLDEVDRQHLYRILAERILAEHSETIRRLAGD